MNRDGFTRFIPVILFVAVVVLIVAAFISISRGIFGESEPVDDPGRTSLTNTGSDRSVRMTVRGPIIAEEEHRSYQISISPDKREFTSYQGYLDRPIDRQQLDNNSQAYEEFVYALDRYGLEWLTLHTALIFRLVRFYLISSVVASKSTRLS